MNKNEQQDSIDIKELDEEPRDSYLLAFTNYSREDRLRKKGGRLYGNWSSSFAGACISTSTNKYIFEESVIRMKRVGKCDKGYEIVLCEHH